MAEIETIQDGKRFLTEHWLKGTECPLCKQTVKLYRRKLSAQMARALIRIYQGDMCGLGWIDVNHFLLSFGINSGEANVALLRHWDLIERKPGAKEDGNPSAGLYRITELGRQFVRGEISVRKHIYLYNGKVYEPELLDTETVNIRQALRDKFNYEELMRVF